MILHFIPFFLSLLIISPESLYEILQYKTFGVINYLEINFWKEKLLGRIGCFLLR